MTRDTGLEEKNIQIFDNVESMLDLSIKNKMNGWRN